MKRREQSVLLAAVLVLALAGCKSTGDTDRLTGSEATMNGGATTQGGGLGATSSTSDSGTTASASDTTGMASTYGTSGTAGTGSSPMAVSTPNSTVTSIEVVQKPADAATGSTAVGGSTTGATGTAMGDRMYRITLRMDDGQTQVITQEWAPSFSTGDRVRMVSGAIQR